MNILIADDERPARSELRHILEEVLDHPSVVEADCGEAAVEAMGQVRLMPSSWTSTWATCGEPP